MELFKVFKRAKKIYKEHGFRELIKSIGSYVRYVIFYYCLRIKGDFEKLEIFSSKDPESVFNFISEEFLGIFKPQQNKNEFLKLLKIFESSVPKRIMEIGTAQGGSLFCFCKLAPKEAEIISTDLPPLATEKYLRQFFKHFPKKEQNLHLLKADSHRKDTLEKVKKILDGKFLDFLFIDADHSYEGVKMDFEMYSPLVRSGGIIAFHDIIIINTHYVQKSQKKSSNNL